MQSFPGRAYPGVCVVLWHCAGRLCSGRNKLLQLLPPERLSVRETESEIVSVSELLQEQHETITSLKFSISMFNVTCLGKF